jgi:hypothetical protein|tara:strand:- start:19 stop:318 length:300 start_codon:yes stop_codon:yes gene_type:complete
MREEIKKARIRKKVLKQYPNAQTVFGDSGIQIMSGDLFIAEEFYLPSTNCEDTAWEYAALACKTKQQFNRTHPSRMDLSDIESKINRINRRRGSRRKRK